MLTAPLTTISNISSCLIGSGFERQVEQRVRCEIDKQVTEMSVCLTVNLTMSEHFVSASGPYKR